MTARRAGMTIVLALAPAATTCAAGQRVAKAAETYRISGVVVDASTGLPVAGAEVSTGGEVELSTTADSEGRFVLAGLQEGKYPLYATALGCVREGYNQHGAFFTGIAVGSELDSEHLVFKLHRQAVVFGRVTDERGDGVRQATVLLFSESLQFGKHRVVMHAQILTNDEGAYRFAHLLPGKYYVGVMARPWYAETGTRSQPKVELEMGTGPQAVSRLQSPPVEPALDMVYPVTYFAGATEETGAVPIVMKAGDAVEANVRLIAVPSVHVLLTNMDDPKRKGQNQGVSAVQQAFGAMNLPLNVLSVEISPGVYEIGGLPPGEVRLMISRGADNEWDSHRIRLNASDGDSVDANARVATSSLSGEVTAADGSKEEMQGEVVLRNGEEQSASGRLRKDGTFTITGVEEGTYEVFVNTRGSGDYVAKVAAVGAKTTGKAVKIEGASEVRLTVTLGRGLGRVAGVARMDGVAKAGLLVLLLPEATGLSKEELEQSVRMDQSDSDGTFGLGGIVPGKYLLMAIDEGWDFEWMDDSELNKYREKGVPLEVGADEVKKVTVEGVKAGRENRK